jgi:hypothetical protein
VDGLLSSSRYCPSLHTLSAAACCCCCLQELEALWQSRICGVLPDSECELLYGRAGYLYSLAWLQQQLGLGTVSSQLMLVSSTGIAVC